ncbi:hypothetical protein FB45DRAFT_493619 [Roridomyces roridus]|uniref:Uncharacterized protein n=1 Tax=Roridomyces roridus TaxID=1738132 RepID=A0AAD7BVY0_9AGAR|nr:hypothetical protein FB45DRAFT_493619 [Roridomyces roridus]
MARSVGEAFGASSWALAASKGLPTLEDHSPTPFSRFPVGGKRENDVVNKENRTWCLVKRRQRWTPCAITRSYDAIEPSMGFATAQHHEFYSKATPIGALDRSSKNQYWPAQCASPYQSRDKDVVDVECTSRTTRSAGPKTPSTSFSSIYFDRKARERYNEKFAVVEFKVNPRI